MGNKLNNNIPYRVSLKDDLNVKILYDEFNGECFNEMDQLVVVVNPGDDSGVVIEDVDGEEHCILPSKLFVSKELFDRIKLLRKNNY